MKKEIKLKEVDILVKRIRKANIISNSAARLQAAKDLGFVSWDELRRSAKNGIITLES